jgi:hypothetical protein
MLHLSKLTNTRVLVQVNLAGDGGHANVEPGVCEKNRTIARYCQKRK